LSETVTVETQPIAIQFNTSTKDLTLDQSFLESIPNITRNPTQLAYLSPVVRNAGNKNEVSPYHHWAGNDMDIGGGTRRRNDVLLDGTPLEAGPKVAYTPPMDAIAEFNVSTNAVDAEFGHSAGGIISMSLKSGTNQYHGTGYYVGRNADWNAVTNRVTRQHSDNTYSQTGGTLGMPLRRNKIFLFTSVESSRVTEVTPQSLTMPTALEKQGDFSQSFNRDGTLRVIYDPWTSRFGPNGQIIRDPFPGNKIPANRFDQLGSQLMSSLWAPNGPGDDRTGLNNFKYNREFDFEYLNFSTRLDWSHNDKWKTFARVSRFVTDQVQPDFTGGADVFKMRPAQGSKRNGGACRRHGLHDERVDRALVRCASGETSAIIRRCRWHPPTMRTCGRTRGTNHTWTDARFCISLKSPWGTTAPTASAAPGGRFPKATACMRASTNICSVTPSSRAAKCASSAARPLASATSTSSSMRTRRRTPRRART
jgi:hypothetical protein